jgi:hypothetical protein
VRFSVASLIIVGAYLLGTVSAATAGTSTFQSRVEAQVGEAEGEHTRSTDILIEGHWHLCYCVF